MARVRRLTFWLLVLISAVTLGHRAGHAAEMRFALVIGNDEYRSVKLATPANDAGLVANALQAAGFAVTGARNLDQTALRESFREFLGQVAAAGPDAIALVYLSGFGLQLAGENYFVPVDADIGRDADVPLQAVRISDFAQPLAALPGRVKIVILDAARQNPFARAGQPLASGLALVDPMPGMAVAFNAAPGTVGPDEVGPYGAYATSLIEMIGAGGLTLDDLFARTRLRVSELSQGAEVPWFASRIDGPFFMTEHAADAPAPPNVVPLADLRRRPMRDYSSAEDAYAAALALDTIEGYEQFLAIYPDNPFSRRVAAMLAVRREEIIWRRCAFDDTPPAYWSYLHRYPRGPHVWDARRRLAMLGAPVDAPPTFAAIDFGIPPPPPDELGFVDQPVVMFWGPGFAPPPPPPLIFLPRRPHEFAELPPPSIVRERFVLPVLGAAVISATVRPPRTVTVPPPPPGGSAGRVPVSLPGAVQRGAVGTPSGAGVRHEERPAGLPAFHQAPPPQPPAPTAAVKPAPLPSPPSGAAPAMLKPVPPPPHLAPPPPAAVKPAPPPPPHPAPPPPPHPAPAAAAKPACPPGKTFAEVNGHPTCK